MCHADGSIPPAAPRVGQFSSGEELHLTGVDGARCMAYLARTTRPAAPAAVILPDFRGLHDFYRRLADQLADAGINAIAIDYFSRVLPDGPRTGDPDEMIPLVMGLSTEQLNGDIQAAVSQLRAHGAEQVFTVGFCFGGSQSWLQSASEQDYAGCIGFYGRPDDCRPRLGQLRAPLLMLVAGADFMTPVEDFDSFDRELADAGVEHTMVVYPDAPHSFFDGAVGHDDACADAWRQLLDFVDARGNQGASR